MVLKSRSVSRVSHVGQLLTSGQGPLGAAMTVEGGVINNVSG